MHSSDSAPADFDPVGAQEYAALLSAVFGESDTDEDPKDEFFTEEEVDSESNEGYLWEKVEDVEGLWYCRSFLSLKQQESLLEAINSEGWFGDPLHNQAMRFGDLPRWANDLSALIHSTSGGQGSFQGLQLQNSNRYTEINWPDEFRDNTSPFPSRILEREPLFDQMIVNSYQPGEGISAHVDLLRFEDGIAIVSLKSSCVMSFRKVRSPSDGVEGNHTEEHVVGPHRDSSPGSHNDVFCPDNNEMLHSRPLFFEQLQASGISPGSKGHKSQSHNSERDPTSGVAEKVDVLLNPGDLIIAHGPARYNWTHEINRDNYHQSWQGEPVVQRHRISVTLRRLCTQKDI